MNAMKVYVNGETTHLKTDTLYDLLRTWELADNGNAKGIAVAVNDNVVPKRQWQDYRLQDNDRIEIVRAIQGG